MDSSTLVIKDQINFKTYSSKVGGLDGRKDVNEAFFSVCSSRLRTQKDFLSLQGHSGRLKTGHYPQYSDYNDGTLVF